ncbi:MAG: ARPP-1 family domain-containing protein [Promethearchaeota archaeon]
MSATDSIEQIHGFADEILADTEFSLVRPVFHNGISFVPIVLREKGVQDYLNAAEALKRGILVITEAGDAVNTIIARNKGDKPVLIEEAEILVSQGSQDRMVVASVILQPSEETRIPVKCVHAPHALNRGSGYGSLGMAAGPMKSSLRSMKYQSIMTDVEHYQPEIAVDQGRVWKEVERYCKTYGIADPTKYSEAIAKLQEIAKDSAEEIHTLLPEGTCGFVAIGSDGNVIALEFYRNSQSLKNRAGVFEMLAIEYGDPHKDPIADEAAWSEAIQLMFQLKEAKPEEVLSKSGQDTIVIGLSRLQGEAVTGETRDGDLKVFYCSLSQST